MCKYPFCGAFILYGFLYILPLICICFFKQAAYHTIRPANLPEMLMSSGMDEAHAAAVSQAWEEGATNLVTQLKEHTMVVNTVINMFKKPYH